MPPSFEFPTSTKVEVWTPLAFDPKDLHGASRRARSLTVVGRMAGGVTGAAGAGRDRGARGTHRHRIQGQQRWLDGARGSGARAARRRVAAGADGADGRGGIPAADRLRQHGQPAAGAAVEPAARDGRARGAGRSRWEVARPIVAESLILSFAGGALGLVAAFGVLRLIANLPEARLPRIEAMQLDGGVLLFTSIISIGVALAFGLLPALHASKQDLRDNMQESSGSTASPYARRLLERTRRDRSRARAGAARGRGTDDAQLHEAAAGESRLRLDRTSSPRACCCRPPSISGRPSSASMRT